jgi:hypothetical protein
MVATGVVFERPLLNPEPEGVVQVYSVPSGMIPIPVEAGLTEKPTPEQVAADMG